ncbi:MAG: hypothetical protein ABIO24_04135 [Saprospiraceae bacterium]
MGVVILKKPIRYKQVIFTVYWLLVAVWGSAQAADSLVLLQTLAAPATFATTDNLGQIYLLTADNAVEKYNTEGQRLAHYSNNRLGVATTIDATNPLKILVWYADFRTAVFLDRSLTELGRLSLDEAGFSLVRSVALSFDGNLWAYDEALFKLKKISPEGVMLFETPALNQLVERAPTAETLQEIGNQVYLADPQQGIFVFDQYASLLTTWKDLPATDFYVVENRQYFLSGNLLHVRNNRSFTETTIPLPQYVAEKSHFRLTEQRLVIWGDGLVRVFQVP